MRNKNIFLSAALFVTIGLTGCQTIKESQNAFVPKSKLKTDWTKNHKPFEVMPDNSLKKLESRIIFFRPSRDDSQSSHINPKNINIGVGSNNAFQVSLTNGHYSDLVVCNGLQLVQARILNKENGKVTSYSKNYEFIPQTTTYLQVASSEVGSPVIQKIPANEALLLLSKSTHQHHQISRVLSDCHI